MMGSIFSAPPMDQRLLLAEEILSTMRGDRFPLYCSRAAIESQCRSVGGAPSRLVFRRWVQNLLGPETKT